MKKVLIALMLAVMPVLASAQGSILKQVLDIVSVEENDVKISVFDMPENDLHQYFLCVGTLGFGDDYVQVQLDPVFQLFIPLGNTLEDAQARLQEFVEVSKGPVGTEIQTEGTLALANPSMGEIEPVYVTAHRLLLERLAEFSVKRNGYVRATHISRANLKTLLSGVKFYRKLHPKE